VRRLIVSLLPGGAASFVLLVPSLMLVDVASDATYFVLICSILLEIIVFYEYFNTYPSILKSAMLHRLTGSGFCTVSCLCIVWPWCLTISCLDSRPVNLANFQCFLGRILDFTGSPVDMLMMSVPSDRPSPFINLYAQRAG
jgi:hypothetical protein